MVLTNLYQMIMLIRVFAFTAVYEITIWKKFQITKKWPKKMPNIKRPQNKIINVLLLLFWYKTENYKK